MKFFIDTANPEEIRKAYEMGVLDGVTTNPTLISKENMEFTPLVQEIFKVVQGLPVSLEVVSSKSEEMILEARRLAKFGVTGGDENMWDPAETPTGCSSPWGAGSTHAACSTARGSAISSSNFATPRTSGTAFAGPCYS